MRIDASAGPPLPPTDAQRKMRAGAEAVRRALAAPPPEEARLALDRLKAARAGAGAGTAATEISEADRASRKRRREALAKELRNLTEQVRMLHKLMDPKSSAREAARLARQIASVAKALADLSKKEPGAGGADAPPLPPTSAPAAAQAGEPAAASQGDGAAEDEGSGSGGGEGEQAHQRQAAVAEQSRETVRATLLANVDARPPGDKDRMRELLERYGALPPPPDRPANLLTKSVRDVLIEASETIRGLKAMIERARDKAKPSKSADARQFQQMADEAEQAVKMVRDLARVVDPTVRVSIIDTDSGGGISA